jgi:predicted DNA-binding transcriptional regulator YafY
MDRTERFYQIDQLLQSGGVVPIERFLRTLGVSRATFKRDLEYLRDRLNAPIEWDRFEGGYRYGKRADGPAFALPGMWFNASEAHALLMMQQLLAELQPGLLRALLGSGDHAAEEVERRVRLFSAARRALRVRHFEAVATATLKRRRLAIDHFSRQDGTTTSRTISPQQLIFYRENWYVVAWCHLREAVRSFAVDAIERAELLDAAARNVPQKQLDELIDSGYGIFSGKEVSWARLRFAPERARWVADETWHPKQRGHYEPDGHWVLELPYADPRELIMDILKHGSSVQVLAPASLRREVQRELAAAQRAYGKGPGSSHEPPAPDTVRIFDDGSCDDERASA